MFLHTLYSLLRFGSYNLYKAMAYLEMMNLDGWLHLDATLFPTEPSGCNFDDVLSTGKAVKIEDTVTDLSDLQWFDEKVDLSFLNDSKSGELLDNIDDLLNFMDGGNDGYLPTDDVSKDLLSETNNGYFVTPPVSPIYQSISEIGSPAGFSLSEPADFSFVDVASPAAFSEVPSPAVYSEVASPTVYSEVASPAVYSEVASPANSDVATDSEHKFGTADSPASTVVSVVAYDSEYSPSSVTYDSDEAFDISEVAEQVRKRKYVPKGGRIPKVSITGVFHPYAKGTRLTSRSERKKVQNKEAAARYREKKRAEDQELLDEVSVLEKEQRELRAQHDDLATEIKYLKKIMREILEKKGVVIN